MELEAVRPERANDRSRPTTDCRPCGLAVRLGSMAADTAVTAVELSAPQVDGFRPRLSDPEVECGRC